MRRRTFFRWISSGFAAFLLPRRVRAQATGLTEADLPMLNEVATVALPTSLGRAHAIEIAGQFRDWIRHYPAGADASYGYGHTHPRVLGPNPSANYAAQLRQLNTAARRKGGDFGKLSDSEKRELLDVALTSAGVSTLPPQPTGQYIATDLMSFFYNSSPGEDFLYNAAIQREDCRGLTNSGKRPAALS